MKNFKSISKNLLGLTVIILALWFGIDHLDGHLLVATLAQINLLHILLASFIIIGVMALSTTRFAYINRKFGGDENWLFLHRVNMLSLLYSQIALPLIAQIIGRVSHGSAERRIYYAPLTVLEKSVAFAIMIFFGGIASYFLLNLNIVPEGLPLALAVMGGAILFVLITSLFLFFTREERHDFLNTILKISHLGIMRILGFSILIQLGILLIYTVLALQFVPDAPLITLIGGFAIVVLATSVPIGFGGWGVREAAAAGIFIALGFPAEIGVIIGILYGLLHLVILGGTILILHPQRRYPASSEQPQRQHNPFAGIDFWPLTTLLILTLLPFQIRLPLGEGLITLNSVDLIALVAMINFILLEWLSGKLQTLWADRLMWVGIICLGLMIIIGWIVGWINFGSNEWATASRLTGFILVISYLFAGAAIRRYIPPPMMARFALVLLFSLLISVVIKIIAFDILGYDAKIFFNWDDRVNGFIADVNAFSFMSGLAVILAAFHLSHYKQQKWQEISLSIIIPILMTFILYTGSRSGLGAAFFVFLWICWAMPRRIPLMIAAVIAVFGFISITNFIVPASKALTLFYGRDLDDIVTSDSLRAYTYQAGIDLFFAHPLFGAGLGAGIRETGFVIHNLYLWILGEMGLIGLALFLPIVIAFIKTSASIVKDDKRRLNKNGRFHAIALFIIICGGFSLVQDIAYQRILWLVLGFLMATPRDPHSLK